MTRTTTSRLLLAAAAVLALTGLAGAQMMTGMPNALQGFSVNREQPVHIKSTTLEVRDKQKRATFIGDVHVAQGDTTMKSNTLDVFYDQEAAPGQPKAAQPAQQPESGQIRRLEAKGNVVVTQKDQIATGDVVIFDTTANTVTMTGNVAVTQGQNIVRGDRLTVNLGTGVSYFEGKPGVPVSGLFSTSRPKEPPKPGDRTEAKPGDARAEAKPADAKPEMRPSDGNGSARSKDGPKPAKQAPGQPLRLQ
jgi:lipopolysaccharide export system protein LptA